MNQAPASMQSQDPILQAYFKEYDYLKQEQLSSINARNHVIFMLLIIYCGVFTYTLAHPGSHYAFLMLPWACFILGWLYFGLQNKIVAIRYYLRDSISPHIIKHAGMPPDSPFAQEKIFLARHPRWMRKLFEIAINLFLFCIPSIVALGIYLLTPTEKSLSIANTMIITDIIFIIILAVWVVMYSSISRQTKPLPSN